MNEQVQTVTINGIKMDVDLRTAVRVDTVKVGTHVKVLIKDSYGEPKVRPGVVVGFEPFATLPTIVVCYIDVTWDSAKLEFAAINDKTKDKYEMVVSVDNDIGFTKQDVLSKMEMERQALVDKLAELRRKKLYFLEHFNKYFAPEPTTAA